MNRKNGVIEMFVCVCGEIFMVISIEEYPKNLTPVEKLNYKRVCDVKCMSCGKIRYSQPYDDANQLNLVKKTEEI